jgi:large subunit ribosomal protein L34e
VFYTLFRKQLQTRQDPRYVHLSFHNLFIGGKLVLHLIKKKAKVSGMRGISAGRPHDMKRMSVCHKTIARPYGGNLTGSEVKDRIMRAFLIDQFKCLS